MYRIQRGKFKHQFFHKKLKQNETLDFDATFGPVSLACSRFFLIFFDFLSFEGICCATGTLDSPSLNRVKAYWHLKGVPVSIKFNQIKFGGIVNKNFVIFELLIEDTSATSQNYYMKYF